ncbi:MAG: RluA family pseudouridine synthase [Clostridia bacterium]|nr:RluA family pseudouridine synthase [Clostridia bacterium]
MKKIIVKESQDSQSILKVILKAFPNLKISSLHKLFRVKNIKVNAKRVKKDYIVSSNDIIEIYATDEVLFSIPKNIVYNYEDENILIAYKPKGLESVSYDEFSFSFEQIVQKDKNNYNIKICHRLDTNTEGLMLFSKNDAANVEMLNAFKKNKIYKNYLAFVHGAMPKQYDYLKGYILKDKKLGVSKIINEKKSHALSVATEYEVLKYLHDYNVSVLNITLYTGRTHQIRAHMKHLGTPIVGDSKYGNSEINNKLGFYSQALFSYKYAFNFSKGSKLEYLNSIYISLDQDEIIENFLKICNKKK